MATIPEALALAIQYHQSGRLQAAEQIYRQILQAEPNHVDAIHLLGMIAHQAGQHGIAVELIERAIRLQGNVPVFHNNLGGMAPIPPCAGFPKRSPAFAGRWNWRLDYTEAHYNLGNVLKEQGKLEDAAACYRRALELQPDYAEAYFNLGNTLQEQGKLDEAAAAYRRALERKPDYAKAHNNLGKTLQDQVKASDEAIACYRARPATGSRITPSPTAIWATPYRTRGSRTKREACQLPTGRWRLKPDFAEAWSNLGNALKDQGKPRTRRWPAIAGAVDLKPDYANAHNNLGNALKDQGQLDRSDGLKAVAEPWTLKPDYAPVHQYARAAIFKAQRMLDEAVAFFRRALELKPDNAEGHSNLGAALHDQGKLDEAAACHRRALALKPDYAEAYSNLGITLKDQGQLDEAAACYRRALEIKPACVDASFNQSLLTLLIGDFGAAVGSNMKGVGKPSEVNVAISSNRSGTANRCTEKPIPSLHAEQGAGATPFSSSATFRSSKMRRRHSRGGVPSAARAGRLLEKFPGVDRLDGGGAPAAGLRCAIAASERVPRPGNHALQTVPADVPYLNADAALVEQWRKELQPLTGFKVGIAWQGNPQFKNDRIGVPSP